ncbi:fungal-specific transcription factor domain-domain-containing protein [Coniella lustricola]|uniref:Fungal-specific transcription factor domain-domain-containing protein n=1 Tax=Coniella lustricola TaxID=2025994 RepID=A0A2T3A0F8_9PEZI|nr:fungal-specific transcription factor domain-domain-containing protein [Coniella lustricola]
MPESISEWLPFDVTQPKRKRAENVCLHCHSKKIKCDFQARHADGFSKCTQCDSSGKDCHLRPSQRAKKHCASARGQRNRPLTPRTDSTDDASLVPNTRVDMQPHSVLDNNHVLLPPFAEVDSILDHADDRSTDTARIRPQSGQPLTTLPSSTHPSRGGPGLLHPSPSEGSHQSTESCCDVIGGGHTDIDTGFLQVYGPENEMDAQEQTIADSFQQKNPLSEPQHQDLMESFAETYWEYLYPWCPVLDPDSLFDEIARSPLLANALATAASHVQPPLIPHSGPAEYYTKARLMFYNDEEWDPLTTLKSVALFYWWAPRAPTTVHRHSSWWWTSVLIRHAQQMNLHREATMSFSSANTRAYGIRRRIWWTAFARERLTALCQSKPAIIDPADCNVNEPSLADFPSDPRSQRKGEVFIWWVRLCAIIGRVAKTLYRPQNDSNSTSNTPDHLRELDEWVNSLPTHLRLPIKTHRTKSYDRDVHQLHLPYLTTVIILHLKRSAHPLPQALPPAILAASCIARILKDILIRGNTRFLMAITCWHTGTAFIPLLQASHIPHLAKDANECLDVLERTAEQLQTMWASANVIRGGFRRLRNTAAETLARSNLLGKDTNSHAELEPSLGNRPYSVPDTFLDTSNRAIDSEESFDWMSLFPFVTRQTSSIADSILTGKEHGITTRAFPSPENAMFHEALMTHFDDLFAIEELDFMPAV